VVCGAVPRWKEQAFLRKVGKRLPVKKPAEAGFDVGRKTVQL
jgi:hypothetical protein